MHALVVLSILVLALLGRMPESQAGWITCPAQVVMLGSAGRRRPGRGDGEAGQPQTQADSLAASDPHLVHTAGAQPVAVGVVGTERASGAGVGEADAVGCVEVAQNLVPNS